MKNRLFSDIRGFPYQENPAYNFFARPTLSSLVKKWRYLNCRIWRVAGPKLGRLVVVI
jgi:hypothetical protein